MPRWMMEFLVAATSAIVDARSFGPEDLARAELRHALTTAYAALARSDARWLRLGVHALNLLSRLRYGRRFSRLPQADATKLLRGVSTSPLRVLRRLIFVLKLLTQYAQFSSASSWPDAGYDGPWLARVDALSPPKLELHP